MSTMVCGSKRPLFEDPMDIPASVSPPLSKRFRRRSPSSSPSPAVFLLAPISAPVDQLSALFPHIEPQILQRALEECGYDLDAAVKRLNDISMGSAGGDGDSAVSSRSNVEQDEVDIPDTPLAPNDLHEDGAEWVNAFVNEMMSSTTLEDAIARATNALEVLEQSISSRVEAEAKQSFEKENMMLKEQMEVLVRENTILKRAVSIQHERHKDYEAKNQEFQHLKQIVPQYQERIRLLEVDNYALRMQLRQAELSHSWPGRFNPDVF